MKSVFNWDSEKNRWLIRERGISFETVVSYLAVGSIMAVVPGKGRYGHQKQFLLSISGYIYVVPFVEKDGEVFLKTIIPSRKLTKQYLEEKTDEKRQIRS
jgi:uncharacterized DUF497 family protein